MTGKTIQIQTTGKNLLKPNDYNVYHELPLKAGTVVTLMTNGQLSEGGNIKFIGMENENVWFAIDKGQTMDLTYTADTKTYIDNKLAAISAAMIGGT